MHARWWACEMVPVFAFYATCQKKNTTKALRRSCEVILRPGVMAHKARIYGASPGIMFRAPERKSGLAPGPAGPDPGDEAPPAPRRRVKETGHISHWGHRPSLFSFPRVPRLSSPRRCLDGLCPTGCSASGFSYMMCVWRLRCDAGGMEGCAASSRPLLFWTTVFHTIFFFDESSRGITNVLQGSDRFSSAFIGLFYFCLRVGILQRIRSDRRYPLQSPSPGRITTRYMHLHHCHGTSACQHLPAPTSTYQASSPPSHHAGAPTRNTTATMRSATLPSLRPSIPRRARSIRQRGRVRRQRITPVK